MLENKYNDEKFFNKYSEMERSKFGLNAAGEWESLKNILPSFENKNILDLGCGYGWHLIYAAQNKANLAVGCDISSKMLDVAREKTKNIDNIKLLMSSIESIDENIKNDEELKNIKFDIVLSSLALHYIEDFDRVVKTVKLLLKDDGCFVFSAEHPIFTAYGSQDWLYNDNGEIVCFPVDNYFYEGKRNTKFLGESVVKYHRTITTYINTLINNGFIIENVTEPTPSEKMLKDNKEMQNELRRPMMIVIKKKKYCL